LLAPSSRELKNTNYEIFIGMLSVLSIFNIVLMYAFLQDAGLQDVLAVMNFVLSGVFMADFIYRILTARSKSGYFFHQYGWADLLASLPFAQLKILRLFRLIRVYRLLHEAGPKPVMHSLVEDRAGSALYVLLTAGLLVLEFGSLGMLRIEEYAPHANITTASDALWYTIVTISTVGYGDQYPVTESGRVLGALIIVVGVGIFGTFTGYLANFFLAPKRNQAADKEDAVGDPRLMLEHLKVLIAEQQAEVEDVETALEREALE
jgi:voltage-gated potassium channel Kch